MSATNGIWLCQTCARLVDADASGHAVAHLREWKELAELHAAAELRGFKLVPDGQTHFDGVEVAIPELIAEMREDLKQHPHCREFVLLEKRWAYNKSPHDNLFVYYYDHRDLRGKIRTLEHYGFVRDISHNDIARFSMAEDFVGYLSADP